MKYITLDSPIGPLTIAADGNYISSLQIAHHPTIPKNWILSSEEKILQQAKTELDQYFSGQRETFTLLLKFKGTPFRKKVWQELIKIPYGQTCTYREIAKRIGNPKAVRAVGTAIGKNPINILIPCHRVIRSDGKIGQFAAGTECKTALLDLEKPRLDNINAH